MQKVTVYQKSPLFGNVVKTEVNLIEIQVREDGKRNVVYKKPRSKYEQSILEDDFPWLVVVDGWNQPDPKPIGGATVSDKSRYAEFHSFYLEEGNELIATNDFNILLDARFFTEFSKYN